MIYKPVIIYKRHNYFESEYRWLNKMTVRNYGRGNRHIIGYQYVLEACLKISSIQRPMKPKSWTWNEGCISCGAEIYSMMRSMHLRACWQQMILPAPSFGRIAQSRHERNKPSSCTTRDWGKDCIQFTRWEPRFFAWIKRAAAMTPTVGKPYWVI